MDGTDQTADDFAIPRAVSRHFDFSASPYTQHEADTIQRRREVYPDGRLMLDGLLELAGIDGPRNYPPTSPAQLRRLLHAIHASEVDRLKQDCFYFYLLLDFDHARSSDTTEAHLTNGASSSDVFSAEGGAEAFAKRRCLTRTWRNFMRGYWALDKGLWEEALESLVDPSISSLNFLPQIISLFASQTSPPSRALTILHRFLTAISPTLESPSEITLRAISLAHSSSLSVAFSFIRSLPIDDRPRIRQELWSWALGAPTLPAGKGSAGVQAEVMKQLLHLPLTSDESAHLTHFLAHPPRSVPPKALDVLHDLVTLRMLHQGQYAESIAVDKALSGRGGEEARQKRRELVREFIAILPPAQRRVLALESESEVRGVFGGVDGSVVQNASADVDVDMGEQGNSSGSFVLPPLPTSTSFNLSTVPAATPALAVMPTSTSIVAARSSAYDSLGSGVGASPRPNTPRVDSPRNVSSPFSGPPQFRIASPSTPITPQSKRPLDRLPSGSPFNLPPGTKVQVPRPPLGVIDDSAEVARRARRVTRSRQISGQSLAETEVSERGMDVDEVGNGNGDEDAHLNANANGDVEVDMEGDGGEDGNQNKRIETRAHEQNRKDMPPPPVPETIRRSSRRPASSSVHGDEEEPPSPTLSKTSRTSTRRKIATVDQDNTARPNGQTRNRMTRSVSRALLDEDEADTAQTPTTKRLRTSRSSVNLNQSKATTEQPKVRRTTRATSVASNASAASGISAVTDVSGAGEDTISELPPASVRRSTRKGRAGSATPSVGASDDGRAVSPTPSGVSVASATSGRGARGRKEGSATPRAKRK